MELPMRLGCGHEQMVDLSRLESRPLSNLIAVEEVVCNFCGTQEACFFTTLQMRESLRKLESMKPTHPSFKWHFAKLLKRAHEIQRRGQELYGALRYQNLAPA